MRIRSIILGIGLVVPLAAVSGCGWLFGYGWLFGGRGTELRLQGTVEV
jgi:hypothetical protein